MKWVGSNYIRSCFILCVHDNKNFKLGSSAIKFDLLSSPFVRLSGELQGKIIYNSFCFYFDNLKPSPPTSISKQLPPNDNNNQAYCYTPHSGRVTEITYLEASSYCISSGKIKSMSKIGSSKFQNPSLSFSATPALSASSLSPSSPSFAHSSSPSPSPSLSPSPCPSRMPIDMIRLPPSESLCVYSLACEKDDIIFVVTDGVHQNLDPEVLKSSPVTLGIPRFAFLILLFLGGRRVLTSN